MIKKINRVLNYSFYYLENYFKKISGRSQIDSYINGEFNLLNLVIKTFKSNGKQFIFFDGGANIGKHSLKVKELLRNHKIKNFKIYAIEPCKKTFLELRKNIEKNNTIFLNIALGSKKKTVNLYTDNKKNSGHNSTIKHYYLDKSESVNQYRIDDIFDEYIKEHISFMKLDIEGSEYDALLGSTNLLSQKKVDLIQIEYNQTWIAAGASIEKILQLCNKFEYSLFRIRKNDLLSIPTYNFILDDFVYSNLLLVRNDINLPMKSSKKALPII